MSKKQNEDTEPEYVDEDEQRVVFSNPELRDVEKTLQSVYGASVEEDEKFEVAAALTGEHLEMVVSLANYDRTKVCRLQGATKVDNDDLEDFLNARADLFEFLSAMLEEFLESSRLRALHIDWKEYDYNERTMYFRSSLENEKVTEMADEWLRKHDPELS
jgi:hypothetical protein